MADVPLPNRHRKHKEKIKKVDSLKETLIEERKRVRRLRVLSILLLGLNIVVGAITAL